MGNCNGAIKALYNLKNIVYVQLIRTLNNMEVCHLVLIENTGKYKHNYTITTLTFFLVTKKYVEGINIECISQEKLTFLLY